MHSANEPQLIAGVGTYAVEIFDELPSLDYVFVPIAGGSGAAACAIVRDGLGARTRIIGVQARQADAFAQSWRGPVRITRDRAETCAEGLATRTTFDLTFSILKNALADVVMLEEEEIRDGISAAIQRTHNLAEGAGAATRAAVRRAGLLRGATVACVMSGGNADARTLRSALISSPPPARR